MDLIDGWAFARVASQALPALDLGGQVRVVGQVLLGGHLLGVTAGHGGQVIGHAQPPDAPAAPLGGDPGGEPRFG
jgi:hypothetical protein